MIKTVLISKDWVYPDIFRQTPNNSGIWGNIRFTDNPNDDFDVVAVLNRPHREIKGTCRENGRILLSQEPPIDIYKWYRKCYKYFDQVYTFWDDYYSGNIKAGQTALPWHIEKSYDELVKLSFDQCKNKINKVSWVTSNAVNKPGHKKRMAFKDFLIEKKFPFALFGKGFNPVDDKFDAIFPYKYSIGIENYFCDDYWTEKISDCYLSWTMPIYCGAKNIFSYFPENSMIDIDLDDFEGSLKKIKDAIYYDVWTKNINAISESRDLIINKYQLFPLLSNICNKSIDWDNEKKVEILIPELKQKKPFSIKNVIYNILSKLKIKLIKNILGRK